MAKGTDCTNVLNIFYISSDLKCTYEFMCLIRKVKCYYTYIVFCICIVLCRD